MGQYKANSTNAKNFKLTFKNENIGELIYKKWHSFKADILMEDGKKYQLEPKGFWGSIIGLKDGTKTLLSFTMGWNGIEINTFFDYKKATYLLKLNGLLSNKFVLIDVNNYELLAAESDFKWKKLNYDYNIETSRVFDKLENKDLLLLTILHCINYYMSLIAAGG